MKTRRRFTAEFKAKVALEAIRGERTISELAPKHQLHPNQITQWKRLSLSQTPSSWRLIENRAMLLLDVRFVQTDLWNGDGPAAVASSA